MVVNNTLKHALILIGLFLTGNSSAATQVQIDTMRAKSLAYLITQQKGDGSWRDGQDNGIIATSTAIEALVNSGIQTGYVPGAAASWLMNAEANSIDSLARQISALAKLGVSVDDLAIQLVALRNQSDGGWGAYKGYQSSMPDTALAYGSLLTANIPNIGVANDTQLAAITSLQGTDGGWPYFKDSPTAKSAMVPTAYGVLVLSRYAKFRTSAATAYATNITNGINWMIARKKNDGGFAEDLDINGTNNPVKSGQVFETALVKAALLAAKDANIPAANTTQANQANQALATIDDFLISKQSSDGAFGAQMLQTANATQAMPLKVLVDTDRDGVPDTVEAFINGSNVNIADSRNLPKGNGNPLSTNQNNSPTNQSADVPLPAWAITALGASLFAVARKKKPSKKSDSETTNVHS